MATRFGDVDLLKLEGFQESTSHNLEWIKSFDNYKAFIYLKDSSWYLQVAKYGVDGVGKTKMTVHKQFADLEGLLNYFRKIEGEFNVRTKN